MLESRDLNVPHWTTPDAFDDGQALFAAVCEHGLEGVVAKRRDDRYWPGARKWIKTKNPAYGRRDSEIESLRRKIERRGVGSPEPV